MEIRSGHSPTMTFFTIPYIALLWNDMVHYQARSEIANLRTRSMQLEDARGDERMGEGEVDTFKGSAKGLYL